MNKLLNNFNFKKCCDTVHQKISTKEHVQLNTGRLIILQQKTTVEMLNVLDKKGHQEITRTHICMSLF